MFYNWQYNTSAYALASNIIKVNSLLEKQQENKYQPVPHL